MDCFFLGLQTGSGGTIDINDANMLYGGNMTSIEMVDYLEVAELLDVNNPFVVVEFIDLKLPPDESLPLSGQLVNTITVTGPGTLLFFDGEGNPPNAPEPNESMGQLYLEQDAEEIFNLTGNPDFNGDNIVDWNDLAILVASWLEYTTDPEDLDGSGFVDFRDFSAFSREWMTHPCDNTDASGTWRDQYFTGIGDCDSWGCWFKEIVSNPVRDNCGNTLYVACEETPEFDYYCAYNYYFNWTRVGLCVYTCGRNYFQVKKNANGSRILQTRHLTRDIPPQDPECYPGGCPGCDQGTSNKYDWQVTHYNNVTGVRTIYCRQSSLEPTSNNLWEPDQGESSDCELYW